LDPGGVFSRNSLVEKLQVDEMFWHQKAEKSNLWKMNFEDKEVTGIIEISPS
jgi:hypothetical protein